MQSIVRVIEHQQSSSDKGPKQLHAVATDQNKTVSLQSSKRNQIPPAMSIITMRGK